MATTYGLTDQGLIIKTLSIIRADLEAAVRAAFGASLTLGDFTLLGQLLGILAERFAELWALAQAVYNSQDPNAATGLSLDNVCAVTGTTRPPATYSSATLTATGTPSTTVPSATVVETFSTQFKFQTTQNGLIVTVSAWAPSTAYVAGDRVTNGGRVYQCTVAGVSAGSGGPAGTTPGGSEIDGTVLTWIFLGDGTGAVDIPALAQNTGVIAAAAYDLRISDTPTAGVNGMINVLDADKGQDIASDQALRLLREQELAADGVSTADAITAALLKVIGVSAVTVYHNDSDTTDSNGVPPHAVECLVTGGADADVGACIFAEVAAGIATYTSTTTSVDVVDSQGVSHTVYFTRPALITVYVDITLTYDADNYPSDGDAEVQLAIANFGGMFKAGRDVTASGMSAQAFTVPGVLDVTQVFIGTSPSPGSSATISVSTRQQAVFETFNVTVHSSPAVP